MEEEIRRLHREQNKGERKLIEQISIQLANKEENEAVLILSAEEKILTEYYLNKVVGEVINEQLKNEKGQIYDIFQKIANDKYESNQYILSLGTPVNFRKLPEDKVEAIVNQKIAGKLWSERLWVNTKALERELKRDMNNLINGRLNTQQLIKKVKDDFRVNRSQSKRLVVTEVARIQNEVNHEFALEEGITKQMFMATLDNATSEICEDLDGKVFDINDSDLPSIPLHPNCRSVLINMPNDEWKPTVRRDNIEKEVGTWTSFEDWKSTMDTE